MVSPTVLSLQLLRKEGYTAEVVEKWISQARIRKDLFGIIDILAIKEGEYGVLGIQTTSTPNMNARLKKASLNKKLLTWYKCGNKFQVWGWQKENGVYAINKKELVKEKFLPKFPRLLTVSP
jgi:hypothetical protein